MKPLIALVLLTACGTLLPGEKAGGLFEVYRDTSVPIAS